MHLARPHIDVGLFSNQRDAQLVFWRDAVGLAYDHMAKLGGGVQQHRHLVNGSILKMNHARDPLPEVPRSGYRELFIAVPGAAESQALVDPDGNRVTLVKPGARDISGIAVRLGVRDVAQASRFYGDVLGFEALAGGVFRCGESLILLEADDAAVLTGDWRARGYRYITVQVHDVDAEHAGILARGGAEGMAPTAFGTTARASFVRDPDGNWIEISERASLTGKPIAASTP